MLEFSFGTRHLAAFPQGNSAADGESVIQCAKILVYLEYIAYNIGHGTPEHQDWSSGETPGYPPVCRKWHAKGELLPARIPHGGTRYCDLHDLQRQQTPSALTLGYARVSRADQQMDPQWPELPQARLAACAGSVLQRGISRLVLTHLDRLLRFGSDLVFALCARRYGRRSHRTQQILEALQGAADRPAPC